MLSDVERWLSSHDGDRPKFSIYMFDLRTRRLSLLVQNGVEPVWSPDGVRIAYRSTQLDFIHFTGMKRQGKL
jgi:Tol biopolymer transport system component